MEVWLNAPVSKGHEALMPSIPWKVVLVSTARMDYCIETALSSVATFTLTLLRPKQRREALQEALSGFFLPSKIGP